MGNLLRESELDQGCEKMEVYDHLRIVFRLRSPETGKKVGHGIERRKDTLQIGRHRSKVVGT